MLSADGGQHILLCVDDVRQRAQGRGYLGAAPSTAAVQGEKGLVPPPVATPASDVASSPLTRRTQYLHQDGWAELVGL